MLEALCVLCELGVRQLLPFERLYFVALQSSGLDPDPLDGAVADEETIAGLIGDAQLNIQVRFASPSLELAIEMAGPSNMHGQGSVWIEFLDGIGIACSQCVRTRQSTSKDRQESGLNGRELIGKPVDAI